MLIHRNGRRSTHRPGTTVVELAVIYSALFLVLFGLILGSIAVFRYHQVAQLAREGSRWAAVHGEMWASEKNSYVLTTPRDVFDNAIQPKAVSMEASKLTYDVTWNQNQKPTHTAIVNDEVKSVSNEVRVVVNYQWDAFLFGPVTLSSTSVSIMHY